jgi:hypothetical protein
MTELQIVAAVMNLVTSHEGVTNTSLSEEQVAQEVHTTRVRMIDDVDKAGLFRRPYTGYIQTIAQLTMTKNSEGKYTAKIPRAVRLINGEHAILYIGGTDGKSPYRIIVNGNGENESHDQFIGKMPMAIVDGEDLSFRNINPKVVKVQMVAEYPDRFAIYGYDDETDEYPFPGGMIDKLIGKAANSYLNTIFRKAPQPNTQSDLTNAGLNAK